MRKQRAIFATLPFLALLSLLFVFFFFSGQHAKTHRDPPPAAHPEFSLLIGILTRPDNYDRRHFLRLVYGVQSPAPFAETHIKFVLCNLTKAEQRVFIALEILRFDDILLLDCAENMNSGKTHAYLSSLPALLPRRYDLVMKADDDVYIRLDPLTRSLRRLNRTDLYYGFGIPCATRGGAADYMSGMGFLLSWDLVEWIAGSDVPANRKVGPEDKMVGEWLRLGRKGRNRVSEKPGMYDYPGSNGRCSHELVPETVAVHRLKRWDRWLHVLRFFNVTAGLKPSKLYHID
ncbi:hypothetical protein H6P81_018321 [Aristolochia fimbriata]|uniref:Hexosyltransferase n=1 Tax=Aristolochia fimbriata TaxID=158543 RepID=A0AAV7E4X3_ARIFI|nr:hypothetical protein H6P81_018321 [Aristolochia fimbriata]